jgi:PleD family two-component response regulator
MLDTESLIRAADSALYDAKGSGKDRACLAPKQESHLE